MRKFEEKCIPQFFIAGLYLYPDQ